MKLTILSCVLIALPAVAAMSCTDDDNGQADAAGAAGNNTSDAGGGAGTANEASVPEGATADAVGPDGSDQVDDAAIQDGDAVLLSQSTGVWVIFEQPYGDGGSANPITATLAGSAKAYALPGDKMRLVLTVAGLPPNRAFGSHLHKLTCDNAKAGPHYQNSPYPDGGSATDPTYANGDNEAWFDFTTDATGAATAETTVNWRPRTGGANAVIIHDMKTGEGGVAGVRLACTNIPF